MPFPDMLGQPLSLLSHRREVEKAPEQAGALPWACSNGLMGKAGPPRSQPLT